MKNRKWSRLWLGLALLGMLVIFSASSDHSHSSCALCALQMGSGLGYLQVNNNTPYNIQVAIRGERNYGPYIIKSNPPYMRVALLQDVYNVYVFVCTPTPEQIPVFYRVYNVNLGKEYETTTLTVTTPIGYIPIIK